jgi:hypothetical protein
MQKNISFLKEKLKIHFNSKILELGAGTGMVSFAVGLLFKPQKVIITDLPHCVSIIASSKSDNACIFKKEVVQFDI